MAGADNEKGEGSPAKGKRINLDDPAPGLDEEQKTELITAEQVKIAKLAPAFGESAETEVIANVSKLGGEGLTQELSLLEKAPPKRGLYTPAGESPGFNSSHAPTQRLPMVQNPGGPPAQSLSVPAIVFILAGGGLVLLCGILIGFALSGLL